VAGNVETAKLMTEAAGAFLDALTPEQRAAVTYALADDAEMRRWAYFPSDFHGLALGAMDARQQKLAHALVASGLSLHAYAKLTSIAALDNVLDVLEGRRRSAVRDPARYFVSVFGSPAESAWAWRFEGHHISLHFAIADSAVVSPTPIFFGSNPADVEHHGRLGSRAILRPCGEEEDLGRELLLSLDDDRRRVAVVHDVAPPDIVLMDLPSVPDVREFELTPGLAGVGRGMLRVEGMTRQTKDAVRFARARPIGLPAAAMDADQRVLLEALIDAYVDRLPEDLAASERALLERQGIDGVHFAWAGGERRREGHYYRLQGGTFIVEYDNTQDGANHVHAVWRDAVRDFGGDTLRRHLRHAH
jgi:hypothetical protein